MFIEQYIFLLSHSKIYSAARENRRIVGEIPAFEERPVELGKAGNLLTV